MRFGPNFLDSIMTRQREHIHSLQAFRDALKYAYMTHFFANPLSILLAKPKKHNLRALIQPEHKQAIRMLPSFRTEIEKLLSEDNVDSVGSLMEDYDGRWGIFDYTLDKLDMARKTVAADITKLCELHGALSVLSTISEIKVVETVELYWYYMAGDLTKSDIINGLLSHIKRLSPSDLKKFLLEFGFTLPGFNPDEQYPDYDPNSFTAKLELYHDFAKGAETREKEEGMTIRNTYGQQAKMQTKVVGQKIELTKGGGTYTDADLEFTERVDELVKHFKQYFTFESPSQFPIELFVYDAKSPYKEAFEARPRHAIERALSSPHDYLGCRCCEGSGGISASQPPTCIVYQLYLNAGNLVNVFDLWSAFRQVFKGDADEDDEDDEEERLLLMRFYQAVADLKMIGAIKPTRRKVDHVSKLMWQGL